ncbi:MAG: acyl carrier protein [Thermodesulfobacteriota bacterium]|nr:acyl carrier protein [Thermodesulfobacteriota bacterium]
MQKDRILKIVSHVMSLPVEQLNEDSSPDTVENWDSIKHLNLVLALEEEFNIVFSDEEIVEMLSVALIVKTLKNKQPAREVVSK